MLRNKLTEFKAILILFDECLHVPERKLTDVSKEFLKYFENAFNKKTVCTIKILQVSTKSIILTNATHFQHDGNFVEHKGHFKDLALIKYCSSGFIDQNNQHHHVILDTYKTSNDLGLDIPDIPLQYWAVVFVTNDKGIGMKKATDWLRELKHSMCWATPLYVPDKYATAEHKNKYAGEKLAVDLRQRFVTSSGNGWFFDFK